MCNINVFVDFHKKCVKNKKSQEIYSSCIKTMFFHKNVKEILKIRRNHIFSLKYKKSTKSVEIKRNQIKNIDLDKILGKV